MAMWDINWPKSMESGCGLKPYWSAGMAWATVTERPLRAAKCLAYSPAAFDGAAETGAGKKQKENRTATTDKEREFMKPPEKFQRRWSLRLVSKPNDK